jgi:hypothetical protein
MFDSYKRSKTNGDETKELGRSIGVATEKHLPDDGLLNRQKIKIEKIDTEIEMLQGRSKINSYTDDLKELDSERDSLNNGIESEIKNKIHLISFDSAKGEAALAIKERFDVTPVEINAAYATESNQISTRIRICNTSDMRTHFDTIGILHIWDRYIEVQSGFEKISDEKDAHESVKLRGSVKDQITKMKEIIDFTLSYLEVQALDLPARYDTPAKEVLEAVNRVMVTAESRYTRKVNAS